MALFGVGGTRRRLPGTIVDMDSAEVSLRGLALGDAFGETWFRSTRAPRLLAPGPWHWTDDTAMALGVFRVLNRHGEIDQDALAQEFATEYTRDPHRNYGPAMHDVLQAIHNGEPWREVAARQFGGLGSWGNGAAMRVPPVGAYFPLDEVADQAIKSAVVTHAHPEAAAGAVAVAVATALSINGVTGSELLDEVIDRVPDGLVREGLRRAQRIGFEVDPRNAAGTLGNGSKLSAPDTVPFVVWSAARRLDDLVEALWDTVIAGGDTDTNSAMVAGIIAPRTGLDAVPAEWWQAAEPLPL
ncbi:ADP-ribosylglycohydrolase family protein [Kibdelosporangium aridum]|uniref:ADP-ribosylglycohydrolase family protein n=1 Tax=Kibdelosporangium aridum TaxID=2030 RepID=UPI000A9519B6